MPSPKMIAWTVALSLATILAVEHYKARAGNAPGVKAATPFRRPA